MGTFNYNRSNLQQRPPRTQFTGFAFFSLMSAYLLLLTAQFLFSTSELPLSDLHFVPPRLSPRRSDLLSRCRRTRTASRHFHKLLPIRPTRVTSAFTPTKEVKQMWRRRGRGFYSPPPHGSGVKVATEIRSRHKMVNVLTLN